MAILSRTNAGVKAILVFLILTVSSGFCSISAVTVDDTDEVRFNREFSLKRASGTVFIYTSDTRGEPIEYIFKDYNAEVLLSLYRNNSRENIIQRTAKKYQLSEEESRRKLKRTINTLEAWSIVIRE